MRQTMIAIATSLILAACAGRKTNVEGQYQAVFNDHRTYIHMEFPRHPKERKDNFLSIMVKDPDNCVSPVPLGWDMGVASAEILEHQMKTGKAIYLVPRSDVSKDGEIVFRALYHNAGGGYVSSCQPITVALDGVGMATAVELMPGAPSVCVHHVGRRIHQCWPDKGAFILR